MLTGVINGMDSFFVWLNSALKQNIADYCDLETAQDTYNLVAKDGSLLSIFRLNGYKSLISMESYINNISEPMRRGLDPFMLKNGHAIQFWFSVNPYKTEEEVRRATRPSYETARRLNLDIEEILEERVKNNATKASSEECYMVLWTRPSALVKSVKKEEAKEKIEMRKKIALPGNVSHISDPFAANGALVNMHDSFVDNIRDLFFKIGLSVDLLDVNSAARSVRSSIDSEFTSPTWEPFLPGQVIRPNVRKDKQKAEEWDIVWPKLSWQVCPRDADFVNDKLVKIGNQVYAPGYIDLLQKELTSFASLFAAVGNKYPWRISMMIEADGLAAVSTRGMFASILGFLSGQNKLLNKGVKVLRELRDSYSLTVVKTKVSFCTWGPEDRAKEVEKQLSDLSRAISSWGICEVSEVTGDPVAGVMSSALGATYNSVATTSAIPLGAMTFIAPLSRPTSAWREGALLFLSPDAKIMPYQPGSSVQTTWIQLIFARPGSGKSVLMNVSNLALCLAPGIPRLPKIGIVDIGPSSSGLISLLQEALPSEKRHLVQYHRLRMTESYSINPFDTQLGCRFPTAAEFNFLTNYVTLLVTDVGDDKPTKGMSGLVSKVITDMYRKFSDTSQSAKRYDRGVNKVVDKILDEIGYQVDARTLWWEIVDELFLKGHYQIASIAQRYAVPLLSDATASAQDEKIRVTLSDLVTETKETLIAYFNRSISDALEHYKILGRPTVFDLGEARIVSLDLDEVAKTGGPAAEKQTAVMYMLARYILGKDYKMDKDTVNEMPYSVTEQVGDNVPVDKYKEYHAKKIEEGKEDFKRLCFDEFHRTSKSLAVREQIQVDMREGRKWNLDITLASQSLKDFDEIMIDFATGIFIMDSGSANDIENLIKNFGMTDIAEKFALENGRVHGPSNGRAGVFMAKFKTSDGSQYTQLLSAHIGAIEMWALSTTAEDVVVRNKLYETIGPAPARRLLAKLYPKGIKKVVEARKENMKSSGSYVDDDSNVYNQLIREILKKGGYA
jgi:intracellular multiplication protein IcmB